MNIFCLKEFVDEIEKLSSKKNYKDIQKILIDYFFEKSINEILSGTRLNGNSDRPFIKKRLEGSGGYRTYFYVVVEDENVYLMFIHPKTGPFGSENIKDEYKAQLLKQVVDCIKKQDLYVVSPNENKDCLVFDKCQSTKVIS